jgi:hypothetical protein
MWNVGLAPLFEKLLSGLQLLAGELDRSGRAGE